MATAPKSASIQLSHVRTGLQTAPLSLVLDNDLKPLPVASLPPEFRNPSSYLKMIVFVPKSAVRNRGIPQTQSVRERARALDVTEPGPFSPEMMADLIFPRNEGPRFTFGEVTVCLPAMEVRRNGELVALPMKEFKTLAYMIQNAGRVIGRDELLNEVWGYTCYPCTRTVDNHIMKLRQKLEVEPSRPQHFLTVHSAGYKFLPQGGGGPEFRGRSL
ncbi:MAG TPA: response regulator transcription factor [Terriglobales bacterium]|nr:response regulator transcription factor [Terriglobales bacterium]